MNKLPRLFTAGFLALGLALPNPVAAHPELSRRVLRPELDHSGLEEALGGRRLPVAFRYQPVLLESVPAFFNRLNDEQKQDFRGRLLRDTKTGHLYLLKYEVPSQPIDTVNGQKKSPYPTQDNPWREFLAARLIRALRGNAVDVVIPPPDERGIFADYLGTQPEALYLSRLSFSYQPGDPEVIQRDPLKAFTRNLVIAVLLRKIDFHDGNLGPLADDGALLMAYDMDMILHSLVSDIRFYAPSFSSNYFQLHHEENQAVFGGLAVRIDLEELSRAVSDIEAFPLEDWLGQLRQTPGIPWTDMAPLADRLRTHQKSIRQDFLDLMGRLLMGSETIDRDWRFSQRILDALGVPPESGLEERRERVLRKLENEIGQPTQFPLTIVRTGGRKGIQVAYEDSTEGITMGGFIPMSQLLDVPVDWIPNGKVRRWVKARQRREERLFARVRDISRVQNSARPVYFASRVPIGRFLSDLLEDGADPRGWLVGAYHAVNRWENIPRQGRTEILRWLAEHVENVRDPKSLLRVFEWAAPSLAETDEARQWAAKGIKALTAEIQQAPAPSAKLTRMDRPQAFPGPHIRWADGTLQFEYPPTEPLEEFWSEEDRRAVELEVKDLVSTFYARSKGMKSSGRPPVRIVARKVPHVNRPPNLGIKDPMKWQPANGNGLVAIERNAAAPVLVVPLDDGFLDQLRSQRNGKPQRFVRDGDLLHLQASFYAAMRELTSAGLEEGPRHRVAVIGAGPAGIGAAQRLVDLGYEVDLFDEKALYGGLAVFGVYPNKEDPMKLAYRFKSLGPTVIMPGVHFYGGVRVGKDGDLTLDDLRQMGYSAVVVAIGAEGSKPLRIPGERPGLPGLYQAKDLVAFYQGDPAASGLDPRLGAISILIGIGNVTVDTTHYAIHRRDYQAVDRFVQSLTREEQKRLLQSLKQRLPGGGQLRRNLGFYRPGVGRTVDVDKLREVLQQADLGEFLGRLEEAWESTADIPSTREVYWVARRGPEQKAFEPKEVEVLAPYIDLEDLRAELRRVAPELGWDPTDAGAMEQHLHDLLFKHPKTGRIDGKPTEKLKRFGTRLDKARIRMRFFLRGHSVEGDHADGIVFARNRMAGGRMEETDEPADKQQLFGKEPVDSVVLSIGNEHDEDFGIRTRKGLFETRADRLVGAGPSPLSHYFEAADAEGLILTGWARVPGTGKVGEAMSDGRNTVQIAVGPYLSEHSELRKDARALAAQRADLNRILAEKGIQAVSGGQAAALHAWFIQNGYQPNDRAEILGIARDFEEQKVTAELLSEARLPEGTRIFAQKNAIPRATQKLFAEQGIEVIELPEDLEQARSLLEAAGDLSNAVAWLSSSVEWFERDEWNGLFAELSVRAVQLVGVMPHSVDRWSLAHWAALFGAFPKAGLQVILSVEEQDRTLSIYV